ncbi:hypothetical protein VNI00_018621 [Paramarasmius palmivorus]|uniref:Uncharacterized protein n=1 Tax=Paramarasmius palmivorus TaxID=297713 RepID=A0AAW0AWE8_9AGAR
MPRQQGARLEYLESKVPGYIVAVHEGYGPEFLAQVVAGYLRRFRPDKGEDYEPTAEELAAIDDDNTAADLVGPLQRYRLCHPYYHCNVMVKAMYGWRGG